MSGGATFTCYVPNRGKRKSVATALSNGNWLKSFSMVGGLELLIDGETVVFRSLQVLLSLLGPCKLDNLFLKRDVVVAPERIFIGVAYENHSCRLIVTIAEQSKRLRKKKLTSLSTIIVSHLLCGIAALVRPTSSQHVFLSLVVRLVLFGFLTASNFLLLSFWSILSFSGLLRLPPIVWPNFAIDIQSADGRCLLQLLFKVRKISRILAPSVRVEKDYWILDGNSSVDLDLSVESDLFHATVSDVKLILNSTSIIPSMAQIIDAVVSLLPFNENYYSREKSSELQGKNALKLTYYFAVVGNVLDLQITETTLNASIYLKLKDLVENYHNDKGCRQKQKYVDDNLYDALDIVSIKFNEIRVHGLSTRYPILLAYMPSFSLNSTHCSPSECSADSGDKETTENTWRVSVSIPGEESKRSFDCTCRQLKLVLNSDSENKVMLTGIASYYSSTPHAKGEKETANHVFRCEKVEVEIFEEFVDFALKKETFVLIKYLCLLANTAIVKSSQGCVRSFLVQEFVLHLFRGAVNKPLQNPRRRRCSISSEDKRDCNSDSDMIDGGEPEKETSVTVTATAGCTTCCKNDFTNDFIRPSRVSTIQSLSQPLQCVSNICLTDLNVVSNEKLTKFTAKKIVQNFGNFFTSNRCI